MDKFGKIMDVAVVVSGGVAVVLHIVNGDWRGLVALAAGACVAHSAMRLWATRNQVRQ